MTQKRIKKAPPKPRRDWRPTFLAALAKTGNVSRACRAARVSRQSAYASRGDPAFAAAWDDALEEAADLLEAEAWRRAKDGVLRPVFQAGKKVGTVREFSDGLLTFLLKGLRPHKFRERSTAEHVKVDLSAMTDAQLDALIAGEPVARVLAMAPARLECSQGADGKSVPIPE
jgi:hypothetical protein